MGASWKESWAEKPGRYRPPVERHAAAGHGPGWRAVSRGFFSVYFFYRIQFLMNFVQNFEQFSYNLSIQTIPMKICLEK
jgi:hypothetical protein